MKLTAYKCYVRPILEYADIVWDPYYQTAIDKIEKIQRRALRFIYNSYDREFSVKNLYETSQVEPLMIRRRNNRLKFFYQLVNNKYKMNPYVYVEPLIESRTRKKNLVQFKRFLPRNDCFKYSFFPWTVVEWNALPDDVTRAENIVSFVNAIRCVN